MIISLARPEDQRQKVENKSCKKRRHHHQKKSTNKQIVVDQFDKSGNISDLGSRVIKEFQKIEPPRLSIREVDNSVEVESNDEKSARSKNAVVKRRRSKTEDIVKGLGLMSKQVGNFLNEDEEEGD